MIRLAVISGKGGTGKTIITATLAMLLLKRRVLADCDVDAANLGILFAKKRISTEPFYGMKNAVIDPSLCNRCGNCLEHCRFHVITSAGGDYTISPLRCEGCGVCTLICPAGAVRMEDRICGETCLSSTAAGNLAHGRLLPGSGNSGLLVHTVKKTALRNDRGSDLFLVDGPPGIGCPLISTVTGMESILIVTEPSVAGLHDLQRVAAVARRYSRQIFVVINRFDLDTQFTRSIETWCSREKIPVLARIPFDPAVIESVRNCRPVLQVPGSPAAQAIQALAAKIDQELFGPGDQDG